MIALEVPDAQVAEEEEEEAEITRTAMVEMDLAQEIIVKDSQEVEIKAQIGTTIVDLVAREEVMVRVFNLNLISL